MSRLKQLRTGAASVLVGLLVSGPAWSGPAEEAAAAPLLEEGTRLMQEGRYAEACPKLEQGQQLDPTLDTLLRLGDCLELNGQLARAWATFQSATATGRHAGDDERTKAAPARAQKLEAVIPKRVINVTPESRVAGLTVLRDDVAVPEASWGSAPAPYCTSPPRPGIRRRRQRPTCASLRAWGATRRVWCWPGASESRPILAIPGGIP